jgi:hypothetical protein
LGGRIFLMRLSGRACRGRGGKKVGGAGRNRTADKGFADPCLTTWRPRHKKLVLRRVGFHRSGGGRGELAPAAQYPAWPKTQQRILAGLKPAYRRQVRSLQMQIRKGSPVSARKQPRWIARTAFRSRWALQRDCPIRSRSRRNCGLFRSPANTSARTRCASCVLRCGSRR